MDLRITCIEGDELLYKAVAFVLNVPPLEKVAPVAQRVDELTLSVAHPPTGQRVHISVGGRDAFDVSVLLERPSPAFLREILASFLKLGGKLHDLAAPETGDILGDDLPAREIARLLAMAGWEESNIARSLSLPECFLLSQDLGTICSNLRSQERKCQNCSMF